MRIAKTSSLPIYYVAGKVAYSMLFHTQLCRMLHIGFVRVARAPGSTESRLEGSAPHQLRRERMWGTCDGPHGAGASPDPSAAAPAPSLQLRTCTQAAI